MTLVFFKEGLKSGKRKFKSAECGKEKGKGTKGRKGSAYDDNGPFGGYTHRRFHYRQYDHDPKRRHSKRYGDQ